jgi:hypothetical protein
VEAIRRDRHTSGAAMELVTGVRTATARESAARVPRARDDAMSRAIIKTGRGIQNMKFVAYNQS